MELTKQQELLGQVISKAWEDENFKKELIKAPIEAIEKLTGKKIELPEGKTLIVRDQTDESTVYINIPAKVDTDVELSEDQLEAVSGGCQWGNSGVSDNYPSFPGPWLSVPTLPIDVIKY